MKFDKDGDIDMAETAKEMVEYYGIGGLIRPLEAQIDDLKAENKKLKEERDHLAEQLEQCIHGPPVENNVLFPL